MSCELVVTGLATRPDVHSKAAKVPCTRSHQAAAAVVWHVTHVIHEARGSRMAPRAAGSHYLPLALPVVPLLLDKAFVDPVKGFSMHLLQLAYLLHELTLAGQPRLHSRVM